MWHPLLRRALARHGRLRGARALSVPRPGPGRRWLRRGGLPSAARSARRAPGGRRGGALPAARLALRPRGPGGAADAAGGAPGGARGPTGAARPHTGGACFAQREHRGRGGRCLRGPVRAGGPPRGAAPAAAARAERAEVAGDEGHGDSVEERVHAPLGHDAKRRRPHTGAAASHAGAGCERHVPLPLLQRLRGGQARRLQRGAGEDGPARPARRPLSRGPPARGLAAGLPLARELHHAQAKLAFAGCPSAQGQRGCPSVPQTSAAG
mmetsp:Transcript_75712/g.245023  ORF Transcript_75712/g.245023 Transcript_75712/m.245023 type:complete len:267 (+) Transcript_75712:103-903(+)